MIRVNELKLVWNTALKVQFSIKISSANATKSSGNYQTHLLKKSFMKHLILSKLPLGPVKISLISSIGTKYNPLNCFIFWGSGHKYLQFESISTVSGNILGCTRHVSITCELFNVFFGPWVSSLSIPLQRMYESSKSKWITTLRTKNRIKN